MEQNNRQPNNINRAGNTSPARRPVTGNNARGQAPQSGNVRKNTAQNTSVQRPAVKKISAAPGTVRPGQTVQNGTVSKPQTGVQSRTGTTARQPQARAPQLSREERQRLLYEEKARIRQKRKAFFDYILSVFILFVICFVAVSLLFCGAFFANLFAHKEPDTKNYSLVLSDYENDAEILDGNVVKNGNTRYVNFSQIADFYGFAMVGSIENMKYVLKESENETVSFSPNSDKVYVNDVAVRTDGPAFYENGDLYVSENFVKDYILGLNFESDTDKRKFAIERVLLNLVDADGKIADGKAPEYENIEFALKAPVITASISETDSAVVMPTFEFYSNISAYEEYMNPGSTTEFLTLVNEDNKLSEDYIPTGLSLLKYGEGMYLKEYAAKSFEAMMLEAQACGVTGVTVTQAYVSYDESQSAYDEVVDKYINLLGNDQANRYAAATVPPPGTDEHQTGLAVDLGLKVGAEFSSSTAFAWLYDNSYKFGFVLRYPPNKTDATGHMYKPEQFRYVGRYHAVRMNALGLTLDEYAEYLGL